MQMNLLDTSQIKALCFYEGDIDRENETDPLLGDRKGYVTWNSLLFPGIGTEKARSSENRFLNPAFIDHMDEVIDLTKMLFSCMSEADEPILLSRVERLSDYYDFVREKRWCSFISTSTAGFLDAYQDKTGLVFLKILCEKGSWHADLSRLLPKYAKAEEAEILLAPYQNIEIHELEMPQELKGIRDSQGRPPCVYAEVYVKGYTDLKAPDITPITTETSAASKRVYEALNLHIEPSAQDVEQYISYKSIIQNELVKMIERRIADR